MKDALKNNVVMKKTTYHITERDGRSGRLAVTIRVKWRHLSRKNRRNESDKKIRHCTEQPLLRK
jgi:hypothetical protein